MADPRPDARALVRAGKTAFRPQAGDRERVLQSLTRALGEGATLGTARRTDPPAGAGGAFPASSWLLGGLGVLAVAGVVGVARPRTATPARDAASTSSSRAPVEQTALPSAAVPSVNADDLPVVAPTEGRSILARPGTRSFVAPSPSDSLPEEVRLLSKAEQQLSSGHADQALMTLGEHERRFPGGALAEERLAARVQSLCALGRINEARADLGRLGRAHSGSALFDRARRFCGIDAP